VYTVAVGKNATQFKIYNFFGEEQGTRSTSLAKHVAHIGRFEMNTKFLSINIKRRDHSED